MTKKRRITVYLLAILFALSVSFMFIAAFNRCGTFPFDISPNGAFGTAPDSHQ